MKILIIGHARHGKDTLAEIWNKEFGMTFISSSMAAAEIFIYEELKEKYNYQSIKECFDDRVNHRSEWFHLICEYNKEDKARLAKEILKKSDCYVGMRSSIEIEECRRQSLFDIIIWVDASGRLEYEDSNSIDIVSGQSDITITNNTSLRGFEYKAKRIGKAIWKD